MASLNIDIFSLLNSLSSSNGADAVRTEVSNWLQNKSSSVPAPTKRKNKKDEVPSGSSSTASEPKKERAPSAWNAFVDHVAGKKGSETEAFKSWLSSQSKDELSGNPKLKYASSLGKNADGSHTDAYRSFAENFKTTQAQSAPAPPSPTLAPIPSSSSPSEPAPSSIPTQDAAPKKRGRKPKAATETPASSSSSTTSEKKRGRPKGSKNKPKAPVAEVADSDIESDSEEVSLTTLTIGSDDYYWNESTGDIYARGEDGSLGDRLGSSTDGKTIVFNTA